MKIFHFLLFNIILGLDELHQGNPYRSYDDAPVDAPIHRPLNHLLVDSNPGYNPNTSQMVFQIFVSDSITKTDQNLGLKWSKHDQDGQNGQNRPK